MENDDNAVGESPKINADETFERAQTTEWFKLSTGNLRFLFIYYILTLVAGLAISIFALFCPHLPINIAFRSMIGGFGMSLVGSTVFYLRKLYKSSIKKYVSIPQTDDEKIRAVGVFVYFFLRPWFAIVFSLLILVILKSSIHSVTTKETQFNEGLIYLMMIISFFVGFAAGDVIIYLESKAKDIATRRISAE